MALISYEEKGKMGFGGGGGGGGGGGRNAKTYGLKGNRLKSISAKNLPLHNYNVIDQKCIK